MLTTVPLTLSGLRAACGEPTMTVEACAICSRIPDSIGIHSAVPSAVWELERFIEKRPVDRGRMLASYGNDEVLHCPTCGRTYLHEHQMEYMEINNPYELPDPPEHRDVFERLTPAQLFHSRWYVLMRIDLDGRFAGHDCWALEQTFFRYHAFGAASLDGAVQSLALPDEAPLVVLDLPTMPRVIAADSPAIVGRELEYASFIDKVTSEYRYNFLDVDSFDDIPWRADLTDAERAQIEELRSASPVEPMALRRTSDAVEIQRWIVAHQKLICRILTVRPTGEVTREDTIVGENIPTYFGRQWGWKLARNRAEPVG